MSFGIDLDLVWGGAHLANAARGTKNNCAQSG
jgi:hypothetical protein